MSARIIVNGEALVLDPAGAVWWPAEQTLVLADLHFEKGSSFARRGQMLPPYDTAATLARIAQLSAAYRPARVIALGDSFHDREGPLRLEENARAALGRLVAACEWIWIEGNHDSAVPTWLGGRTAPEIAMGGLVFHHEPTGLGAGEIAGHLHPCASISMRGRNMRRRCFVTDGQRMVLPSLGAFTGGLDVRDAAFLPLFADRYVAYALGARGVYAVAAKGSARMLLREQEAPVAPDELRIAIAR